MPAQAQADSRLVALLPAAGLEEDLGTEHRKALRRRGSARLVVHHGCSVLASVIRCRASNVFVVQSGSPMNSQLGCPSSVPHRKFSGQHVWEPSNGRQSTAFGSALPSARWQGYAFGSGVKTALCVLHAPKTTSATQRAKNAFTCTWLLPRKSSPP